MEIAGDQAVSAVVVQTLKTSQSYTKICVTVDLVIVNGTQISFFFFRFLIFLDIFESSFSITLTDLV